MVNIRDNKKKGRSTMLSIRRAKENEGIVSIYFRELGHLLYHEIILTILKDDFKCEVLSHDDFITDIDSRLRWNGIEFDFLHHYIFGNYIAAPPEHADALEQLANQVADIINEKVSKGKKGKKTPRT